LRAFICEESGGKELCLELVDTNLSIYIKLLIYLLSFLPVCLALGSSAPCIYSHIYVSVSLSLHLPCMAHRSSNLFSLVDVCTPVPVPAPVPFPKRN
jgi:hypothetical protein